MQKFISQRSIVKWILAAALGTAAVFSFWRHVPLITGLFSGCLSVLLNFFLIYSEVVKMGDGKQPVSVSSFWKTFPVRFLVMIGLFYLFLVVLKVNILAFLAGVIATFSFLMLRVGSHLLFCKNKTTA